MTLRNVTRQQLEREVQELRSTIEAIVDTISCNDLSAAEKVIEVKALLDVEFDEEEEGEGGDPTREGG